VALVERHRMGGDCLNTGCVPSKALLRPAKLLSQIARSKEFGIAEAGARVDFADVMERVARVVSTVAPHDSVERYTALGVECVHGDGRITTPWTVEVETATGPRTLTTKSIVIATGARPFVPPIPGLERTGYLTSDTLWGLRVLPARLVVLGGGPIGCELAQAFARFGSRVTQVEMASRLLMREDPEVADFVLQRFRDEGVDVRVGHKAVRAESDGGSKRLVCEHEGREIVFECDAILVAAGRMPNTAGLGLEALGIATTATGAVETDESLQARYPNIVACGDVVGPLHFTHVASHQAWYAAVNGLFGAFRRFRVDDRVIPWCTFTDPEVARVGLSETEARDRGIAYTATVYDIGDLDRAIADGAAQGFVKVLTAPGTDRILGATIVGEHAGDLIAEYVLAMKHGLGLNRILGTIHIYPTLAEANKYAAGAWKRSTVTRGQWAVLDALQAWQRGAGGIAAVLRAVIAMRRDRRPAYAEAAKTRPAE
jgi:pyruvate/2-oxoglutarate dehydrogenase complex dihydrolipoamide dehydrogenase (E3) component